MTNIISAISGRLSKSLTLGTLLPTALFVFLNMVLLRGIYKGDVPVWSQFEAFGLGNEWRGIAVLLIIILLTGLLYGLNSPVIRFYEGYSWQNSRIGRALTQRYRDRFESYDARWTGMLTLRRRMEATNDPRLGEVSRKWAKIGRELNSGFPKDSHLLLPTRLGNIIRSLEDYSYRQYGMEAITLWPRLVGKVDKGYAAVIDDAKASFDFILNMSFLSAILALELLIVGLLYVPLNSPRWLLLLFEIVVLTVAAYVLYRGSIRRASLWVATIAGAFDLYRWDLLKQLGYQQSPAAGAQERNLWESIYFRMLYPASPAIERPPYFNTPTFASARTNFPGGIPHVVSLEVARGVDNEATDEKVEVTLWIRNADTQHDARGVVVTDTIPEGFDYVWDSVRCVDGCKIVKVVGANPYQFYIGSLERGRSATITYHIACLVPRTE